MTVIRFVAIVVFFSLGLAVAATSWRSRYKWPLFWAFQVVFFTLLFVHIRTGGQW